jgi:hypothetical protein
MRSGVILPITQKVIEEQHPASRHAIFILDSLGSSSVLLQSAKTTLAAMSLEGSSWSFHFGTSYRKEKSSDMYW